MHRRNTYTRERLEFGLATSHPKRSRSLTALQAPSLAALATEAKAIAAPLPLLHITILEAAWNYIAPKTTHKYSTASAVISYLRFVGGLNDQRRLLSPYFESRVTYHLRF